MLCGIGLVPSGLGLAFDGFLSSHIRMLCPVCHLMVSPLQFHQSFVQPMRAVLMKPVHAVLGPPSYNAESIFLISQHTGVHFMCKSRSRSKCRALLEVSNFGSQCLL